MIWIKYSCKVILHTLKDEGMVTITFMWIKYMTYYSWLSMGTLQDGETIHLIPKDLNPYQVEKYI